VIPKNIIIHHSLTKDSGTVSWGAIRKYHIETLGWDDIGYNFGIELVGDHYEILIGRMPNVQGAHTKGMNHDSLGICMVGNFDIESPPKEQWDMGVKLCEYLMHIYDIQPDNIYAHRDWASYKSCPGNMFSIMAFRMELYL